MPASLSDPPAVGAQALVNRPLASRPIRARKPAPDVSPPFSDLLAHHPLIGTEE